MKAIIKIILLIILIALIYSAYQNNNKDNDDNIVQFTPQVPYVTTNNVAGWAPPQVIDYKIAPLDREALLRDTSLLSFQSPDFDSQPDDPEDVVDKINYEIRDAKSDGFCGSSNALRLNDNPKTCNRETIKDVYDRLTRNIKAKPQEIACTRNRDTLTGERLYLDVDHINTTIRPDTILYKNENVSNGGEFYDDIRACDPRDNTHQCTL